MQGEKGKIMFGSCDFTFWLIFWTQPLHKSRDTYISFYFLMYMAYMRKYWSHEEDWSWDFEEFTCFEPPWIWRGGFRNVVCMYVYMYLATLAPQWFNRFYSYSVFKSLFIVGQGLVSMNIPAPKIGPFRWTSKNKMIF
jgi:hypothetical protein